MCVKPSAFGCEFGAVAGIPVVLAAGEIDIASAPAFRDALLSQAGDAAPACLIVDVREVPFMDSEGLRVLLGVRLFFPDGLVVAGARPALRRIFMVTGADRLFPLAESPTQAAMLLRSCRP